MKLYLNEGETVTVVRNHKPESHAVVVANWGGELLGVREFCDGQPQNNSEAEATPTNSAMDAIALWKELFQSPPTASGFSKFLHSNKDRINAVLAQQHQ